MIFEGTIRGTFTGRRLATYFNAATSDWIDARRIVNGLDRAERSAGYSRAFYRAILAATTPEVAASTPPPMPDPVSIADDLEAVPEAPAEEADIREIDEEIRELLRDLSRAG